jgi:hypothetical protein
MRDRPLGSSIMSKLIESQWFYGPLPYLLLPIVHGECRTSLSPNRSCWHTLPISVTATLTLAPGRSPRRLHRALAALRLPSQTVVAGPASGAQSSLPICHRTVPSVRSAEGAQNGIFCRVLAICWRMRGEVQQPEPAAPSHEGMTTAACVTASSANATMERLTTRGRWLGLSGHDYGRYAAILHLTVMIGIAFAQAHRTYGPAGHRTHVWGARIRVQTVLWHRSSRICPQVKDSQAWIARPFTKRLLSILVYAPVVLRTLTSSNSGLLNHQALP